MHRRFGESSASTPDPRLSTFRRVVLLMLLMTLFLHGGGQARTFLMPSSDTSVPVAPNGLGNVVPDTLINLLDLVRLRDIANGIHGAPTPQEQFQGDLNIDGVIDAEDVDLLSKVLLQVQGPPQLIDASLGGEVLSEHVAMTFSARDLGSSAVMGIVKKSPAQLRGETGVEFAELAADSTYYITGWELDTSAPDIVYPPAMEVGFDVMPPCELEGANLLMTARRGPLGKTELVMLTELEVTQDSTLISPEPPFPVMSPPSNTHLEPLQYLRIPVTNISRNHLGNAVMFTQDNVSWVMNASSWFEPIDYMGVAEIEDIVVAVPDMPAGHTTVKLLHLGTGLISEELGIEILPLHTPVGTPDTPLIEAFAAIDTMLTIYPDCLVFQSYPFTETADWRAEVPNMRPAYTALRDSILSSSLETQNEFLAWIENLDLVARVDTALTYFDVDGRIAGEAILRATRSVLTLGNFGRDQTSGPPIVSSIPYIPFQASVESHVDYGPNLPTDRALDHGSIAKSRSGFSCGPLGPFADGTDIGDLEAEVKQAAMANTGAGISRGPVYWSPAKLARAADASFDPHGYPGFCMNIWIHNTNAQGSAAGGSGCGGGKAELFGQDRAEKVVIPADFQELVQNHLSPLAGSIVTPVNGGIPGIVGVVDNAGSFAIPGLRPGTEVHFSIYDPTTGLFDADAGYAVTPSVAELGLWFPVSLKFRPESESLIQPLALNQEVADFIDTSQYRIEYLMERDDRDPGSVSLGFCATAPMKFLVTAPDGTVLVDLGDDQTFLDLAFIMDQEGTYSIVVAFGQSIESGSFTLGTWDRYNYPKQEISCEAWGLLHDGLSPYTVTADAVIPAGRELVASPGQIIEFAAGSSMQAVGEFRGTGRVDAPLILRPSISPIVSK